MIRDWLRRWLGIEQLERSLDDLWLREVNRQAAPVELIVPQAWVLSDEEQAKAERTLRRRSSGNA